MKKTLILTLAIGFSSFAKAQLANTSWKGNFNVPDPTEMILQFKADSVLLDYTYGVTLETMSYSINNDTLFLRKLDGRSDCSYSDNASYKFGIKDKKLVLSLINDGCATRADAWPSDGLEIIEADNLK